jgi:hypothetical protein
MAQHRRPAPNRRQASRLPPQVRGLARPPELSDLPARVVYGKPFILLEDAEKNTFVFSGGNWVAYESTIAELRSTCQVKALPQGVGKMSRYEIRAPLNG